MKIQSYILGAWQEGNDKGQVALNAINGEPVGEVTSSGFDFKRILEYGRKAGSTKLRELTFHERALLLKKLATYLMQRKDEFYATSSLTGATKVDSWIDIEGGIGTLFAFSSKGRRELPNEPFLTEGNMEAISKNGTFVGQHICVPLEGVALHINAFNFPCWGMLEKLSPTILAGMGAIIKPASITSYLAEKMVKAIIESKILPEGSLQLICGSVGDILDHVTCQDVLTFTGSASTGKKLKNHPALTENSVRFNMEADSLNFSMLGLDAAPGTEEFDLFIKEVSREMTVKAGQKCTAVRRAIVPDNFVADVIKELSKRLSTTTLGDPALEGVRMGPLAGKAQANEVAERAKEIAAECELVYGDPKNFEIKGGDKLRGGFFPALLYYCKDAFKNSAPHQIEAFGPVSTILPYKTVDQAVEIARLGRGSLVGSVVSNDNKFAEQIALGAAAYHGRLMFLNRHCAKESTGHGSPLPHLVHGGPGRAGGGEEMGGIRGVLHYMQRTALQGSPTTLSSICQQWLKGSEIKKDKIHPFRKHFEELEIGETLVTHRRTITEADIVNFAGISGDNFYAHTDDIAAKESIFGARVAHGYFVLAAAAGLFVDPAPGPVLANYGLEGLRFIKPVFIGDSIQVKLTCKQKTAKENKEGQIPQGVVAWDVEVYNQNSEIVALYTILTLVASVHAA